MCFQQACSLSTEQNTSQNDSVLGKALSLTDLRNNQRVIQRPRIGPGSSHIRKQDVPVAMGSIWELMKPSTKAKVGPIRQESCMCRTALKCT